MTHRLISNWSKQEVAVIIFLLRLKIQVPYICELLGHGESDVRLDALWYSLSFFSFTNNRGVTYLMCAGQKEVDAAIAQNVLPTLVGCLMSDNSQLQVPALRYTVFSLVN